MKTKSEFYEEIYFIDDILDASERQMDNLLMCGNKNRDYYFHALEPDVKTEVEKIENVELIEFESEKDMCEFLGKIDDRQMINFSTQHENPCVLKFAQ